MRKLTVSNPLLQKHDIYTIDQFGTDIPVNSAEQSVVDQVRAAGIDLRRLDQLNATEDNYSEAIPVLLRSVANTALPDNIRAAAASTLQRKFAHDLVFDSIISLYEKTPCDVSSPLKDSLANVLIATARKDDLPKLFPVVLNPMHKDDRILLLLILKKFRTKEVKGVLKELLNDPYPDVAAYAKNVLGQKSFSKL
jgi:hypothetical protein